MIDLKSLNNFLEEYLEDTTLKDFVFVKNLNDIILKNTCFPKEVYYKRKIKLNNAIRLSYSFLECVNESYASYFEERLFDGTILFSQDFEIGESYYDCNANKRVINIPITESIEDSYVIIHEILHDMNLDETIDSKCRVLITEAISILGELLFRDFLIKNNLLKRDANKVILNIFYSIHKISSLTDLELNIINEYLKIGYVSMNFLKSILFNYEDDVIDKSILNSGKELEIDYNQRYIIGIFFACYIYDRIKKYPKMIGELMDINSIMNSVFFEDIIYYLNLDIKSDDEYILLTASSLKKLEKTYKKTLKEL